MTDLQKTLTAYFGRDHDEIDALLAGVDWTKPKAALLRLAEFDRRLERHIVWEEGTLFPAVASVALSLEEGPIAVMKKEHELIRALKKEALKALRRGDGAVAKSRVAEMLDILGPHNTKEEHILYPLCDRFLPQPAARAILDKIKAAAGSRQ